MELTNNPKLTSGDTAKVGEAEAVDTTPGSVKPAKFSLKITKKPVPNTPRGVLAE